MVYVYAVYQEKSFSKAAEKLFISQPALSAMVKKAEQEIQTQIFDRSTIPISLTAAGEYYIESIEKIMQIQHDMELYFKMLANPAEKRLGFGGSAYFCAYVLPPVVKRFQAAYPDVQVHWTEGRNIELVDQLLNGDIDFAPEVDEVENENIRAFIWGKEMVILAVPCNAPINNVLKEYRFTAEDIHDRRHLSDETPAVKPEAFANEPFILLREGNDSYKRGLTICQDAGFVPRVTMTVDSLMTSYYLAAEGNGVAFVRDSILYYADLTDKLYFYKIDHPLAVRNVYLYYRNARLSRTAEAFLNFVKEEKQNPFSRL